MAYVAPHLSLTEYQCRHCNKLPPDFSDAIIYRVFFDEYWVILRGTFDSPIDVTSGYRCPPHNRAIGGEACSAHCTGLALDCKPRNGNVQLIAQIVEEKIPNARMKVYPTFVHIDTAWMCNPRLRDNWVKGYRFHD